MLMAAGSKRTKGSANVPLGPRRLETCGLCGSAGNLTRTPCCGNLICDDLDEYVMFSYARNSCYRNHSHQTVCAFHHNAEHAGDWKTRDECRSKCPPELYAWYVTNEYNFEKVANPPPFEPTLCDRCGKRIVQPAGGYVRGPQGIWCQACDDYPPPDLARIRKVAKKRRG